MRVVEIHCLKDGRLIKLPWYGYDDQQFDMGKNQRLMRLRYATRFYSGHNGGMSGWLWRQQFGRQQFGLREEM